ncbi:MAG: RDD family protein [Patescibacteria group bacterium]|nr:RDD family protein [Patescibacteria group bacterium]
MSISDLQQEKKAGLGQNKAGQNEQKAQTEAAESFSQISQSVQTVKYAGFWIRFCAFFIDIIIVVILGLILSFIIGFLFDVSRIDRDAIAPISQLLGVLISWGYFIYMTYNYKATFGKRAFGLCVIPTDGEQLDLGQVVLRETVGRIVSTIIFCIGYFMIGFDAKKQGMHDKIGKTAVIYANPEKSSSVIGIVAVIIAAIFVFIALISMRALTGLNSARTHAESAYAKSIINQVKISSAVCFKNNGSIVAPQTPLGGGKMCSIGPETFWPELANGFKYGYVSDNSIAIIDRHGKVFKCTMRYGECNF